MNYINCINYLAYTSISTVVSRCHNTTSYHLGKVLWALGKMLKVLWALGKMLKVLWALGQMLWLWVRCCVVAPRNHSKYRNQIHIHVVILCYISFLLFILLCWSCGVSICEKNHFIIKITNLQLHWNNPEMKSTYTDSSGMTLFYTDQRRPYNAGVLSIGPLFLQIPPGMYNNETVIYVNLKLDLVTVPT